MRTASLCILMALVMFQASAADVPRTMSYQGVLRDAAGDPVPDGAYSITFALYSLPAGGTALWTETQSVSVEGGVMSAVLGSVTPLALAFDASYWLGVSIDGNPELSPRVELTSAPYARRAEFADVAVSDGDWTVSGSDIYRYGGNVGIGSTMTPMFPLDIWDDTNGFMGIRIKNDNVNGQSREGIYLSNEDGDLAGIFTYDDGSAYPSAMIIANNRPGGNVRLNTAGAERVRIDNAGHVGIGETNPSSLLDVGGTAEVAGFQMATGAAAGRVLTSDASGVGTWQAMPAGFTLPYEGSGAVPETSAVFKIWSTDTGSAIYGQNSHFMGGTAGYLADTFDGVVGEHFETRNFGTLGSYYYGVHAKARADHATAVYARHDPTMHSARLANADYAGAFSGDVVVENGSLAIGTDTPADDLDVQGEVVVTSPHSGPALNIQKTYTSSVGQTVNFERTVDASAGNDILQISATSGSPDNFQFIECDRGGVIEWAVQGNGTTTSKGSYVSRDIQVCEMMAVGSGARSVEAGDVMVIDPASRRTLAQSSKARSTLVAGIYCADPGVVGSSRGWVREGATDEGGAAAYTLEDMADEFGEIPLAVVGVVPCKVCAENGAISPGDLLVTSDTPGHAMRDASPAPGTIVGKALGRLDAGTGLIDVLVTLQ
jgi:hypothetical protein